MVLIMSKRRIDDNYEVSESYDKRIQRNRIHSEAHIKTVELMINLAKKLGNKPENISSDDIQDQQNQSTYTQKPYWPVINRVID